MQKGLSLVQTVVVIESSLLFSAKKGSVDVAIPWTLRDNLSVDRMLNQHRLLLEAEWHW